MLEIIFSGDFAPIIPAEQIDGDHFSDLKEVLNSTDIHITNLECPLTIQEKVIEKTGPVLRAHPSAVSILKEANVNIVCLANNHIFDLGENGIKETIKICKDNNIDITGINDTDDQTKWIFKYVKGKRIGILNYCEKEFSVREDGLLSANGYDPISVFYDINLIRAQTDLLIVVYHGGNEYYPLPRPELKKDFHYLADLGADMVIGHHTHVFSGYEVYNGKPLIYSLGNFFFPYKGEPESWYEGILLKCIIDESIEFELIPFYQCKDGFKVNLMKGGKKESTINQIKNLSSIIADNTKLGEAWNTFVHHTGLRLARQILFPTMIDKGILKIPIFNKFVLDENRRRSLINILRCTSLEQLLIDGLKLKQ